MCIPHGILALLALSGAYHQWVAEFVVEGQYPSTAEAIAATAAEWKVIDSDYWSGDQVLPTYVLLDSYPEIGVAMINIELFQIPINPQ